MGKLYRLHSQTRCKRSPNSQYRYDKYEQSLENLLELYGACRKISKIVHVYVGCGPGLFSWVVHDYFKHWKSEMKIKWHAYDHCRAMFRLAKWLWCEFETSIHLGLTSDQDELIFQVMRSGPSADAILIFRHTLVRTSDQEDPVNSFAKILRYIWLASNLVVAIDLQDDSAIQRFCQSIARLTNALVKYSIKVYSIYSSGGNWVAALFRPAVAGS